jgi:Na+/serine symporter
MLGALISLLVVAVVGFVVLTVLLAIFAAIFGLAIGILGLAFALALKILPVVLVGWLVVKLLQRSDRSGGARSRLSADDRRWLDS